MLMGIEVKLLLCLPVCSVHLLSSLNPGGDRSFPESVNLTSPPIQHLSVGTSLPVPKQSPLEQYCNDPDSVICLQHRVWGIVLK